MGVAASWGEGGLLSNAQPDRLGGGGIRPSLRYFCLRHAFRRVREASTLRGATQRDGPPPCLAFLQGRPPPPQSHNKTRPSARRRRTLVGDEEEEPHDQTPAGDQEESALVEELGQASHASAVHYRGPDGAAARGDECPPDLPGRGWGPRWGTVWGGSRQDPATPPAPSKQGISQTPLPCS